MENYHSYKIEYCLRILNSNKNGISQNEAKRRIKKYGFNEIVNNNENSKYNIIFNQFKSPLVYILVIATFISLILKDYTEATVIILVVLINAVIGFIQENKANNALEKLKKLVEHKAIVLRKEGETEINSKYLTIGDIIIIREGDRIPADGRILESYDLQADESALTGESMPVFKTIDNLKEGISLADRKNMVYSGSLITEGNGKAVITAIGKHTAIGQIAKIVSETDEGKTPLQKKLDNFIKLLAIFLLSLSFITISIGLIKGLSLYEMFITGVALAISSIPEGLNIAITVILALGMQNILKNKALTRKLIAAETLGSVSVICTDKTGTLTEGVMSVAHIIIGDNEFNFSKLAEIKNNNVHEKQICCALEAGIMCNSAIIDKSNNELTETKILGSPTEIALMKAGLDYGLEKTNLLKKEPLLDELPFSNENKFMITFHKKNDGYVIYEKGAPEKILSKSVYYFHNGCIKKIDYNVRKKLDLLYKKYTSKGLRVVAVAKKELNSYYPKSSANWREIDNRLIFIGFFAIKDPLRKDIKETINLCIKSGIWPVIITGDHKLTAMAIAREAGLKVSDNNIMTGDELDKIDDSSIKNIIKKIIVYARVSPHHKLRIINTLKSMGKIVAMTGDGINDSPALKAADIGISLGNGTDIAKETSDMVLLDNSFKTIIFSIKEGRIIYSNIRKTITFLLSDTFSQMILIAASILLGLPLALLPVQILWMNIIQDGFPSFMLAFEREDDNIMDEKPIPKKEGILNKEMKLIIFFAGLLRDVFILYFFIVFYKNNFNINYIRTLIFCMLTVNSLFILFSLRSLTKPIWKIKFFSNIYLIFSAIGAFILILLSVYFYPIKSLLGTVNIYATDWILIFSFGFVNLLIIEIIKYYSNIKFLKNINNGNILKEKLLNL